MDETNKEKNFIFPKKITTIHSYDYNIDTLFNVVRDFHIVSDYFVDMRSGVTFLIGNNTYEVGNKFTFNWYYQTILVFNVKEYINNENYKKVCWRVDSDLWNISYDYSYEIQSNTIEENSIFIWDIIYDDPEKLPFTRTTLKDYHRILLDTCNRFKRYLKDNWSKLEQTESLIINSNREKIWQNLINLNKLYLLDEEQNLKFEYDGDHIVDNLQISMKDKDENIIDKFIVKKLNFSYDEEKWSYEMEKIQSINKTPHQNINFTLIEISEKKNFVIVTHKFVNPIRREEYLKLSKDKKNILLRLKSQMEKDFSVL